MMRLEFHRYARTLEGEFIKETSVFMPAHINDDRGVPLPGFEGKWILCGVIHPLSEFGFAGGIAKGKVEAQHPLYFGPFSPLPLKTGYELVTQEVFDAGVAKNLEAHKAKQDSRIEAAAYIKSSATEKLKQLGLSREEIALLTR